jgi:ectoine hydroxylase-related dioxygenase (phytanoyl-CoA dioxygenase family)
MPELVHFTRGDSLEQIFAILERDGGLVIDGLFDAEVVEQLATDFQRELDDVPWGNNDEPDQSEAEDVFFGYRTKRLHGLIARSSAFERVLTDEFALACANRVLGDYSKDVILSTNELMAIGAAEVQQAFHRDGDTWRHMPQPRPELLVSFNLALTDFTADNGATVVVPGSHRWDRSRKPMPDEVARAVMPKGSALLYMGEVLHAGGANATGQTRIGAYFGYIPSWLRPLENCYVTLTEAAMRALTPAAQRLVGYSETGFQVIL